LIGKLMIDIAVLRHIGAHRDDHFPQTGIGGQLPVCDCILGNRNSGVGATVHASQIFGVAVNGFFLEVTNDSMRRPGRAHAEEK
jgi:hypothetical protein